ncbi:peptide chain release factor H [Flavihumibacter sp. R14]|nr:peptide chain release factor H [Flavihumibacter soli]
MKKVIIQLTSGKGPAECCRAVFRIREIMIKQASAQGINIVEIDSKKADRDATLLSVTLAAQGDNLQAFIQEWKGTIQWIAKSPYRPYHQRKNWFAGVSIFDVKEFAEWNPHEVKIETCRASGPGGQNVNKVETAVRGTHIPSGIQVFAMDSRSQLENKKLCLSRLEAKVMSWQAEQLAQNQVNQWLSHLSLSRGNPIKTFRMDLS